MTIAPGDGRDRLSTQKAISRFAYRHYVSSAH
jgi:hypothetical protein